ncbi:MAG TPA: hypothetical protein PLY19_06640 [Rhodoglobus sp.]|nr:hypothetical protein [Rhodoglobus sp.]
MKTYPPVPKAMKTYLPDTSPWNGDPERRCTATRRSGERCRQRSIPGGTVCRVHGGATPVAKAAAERRLAEQRAAIEAAKHGLVVPRDVEPGAALLEAIHSAAGELDYWRSVVAQIDPEALTWGVTQATTKKGKRKITETAGAAAAYKLMVDAQDRLARYSASALRAGIEERRVQLAETQGHALAGVVRAVLGRMLDATITLLRTQGVDDATIIAALREGWTTTMAEVVPDEVRRLAIGGNTG